MLAAVRDLREHRVPASPEELEQFEVDVLAGFVLARASSGVTDATIRGEVGHLEHIRTWVLWRILHLTQVRTLVSVRSMATWPMLRSPRWHSSTISALNSGVNDRRGRGFFLSMVSILDILSGAVPLLVDVRQSGGSPVHQSTGINQLPTQHVKTRGSVGGFLNDSFDASTNLEPFFAIDQEAKHPAVSRQWELD